VTNPNLDFLIQSQLDVLEGLATELADEGDWQEWWAHYSQDKKREIAERICNVHAEGMKVCAKLWRARLEKL